MKLLLTNDDGIGSPFLRLLSLAAREHGHQIVICAPSVQQSTSSHRYHTAKPILVHPVQTDAADQAWAVDGTPVDCVRIALRKLCPDADMVLSGVNLGYNTGWPVYASGTVGAAREAMFTGVPGIALSAEPSTPPDTLERFLAWTMKLLDRIHATPHALAGVWNLNAPCVPAECLLPPVMCTLNPAIYLDDYDMRPAPDGAWTCQLRGLPQPPPIPGHDLALLQAGHITCTVLTPVPAPQEPFAPCLPPIDANP